MEPDVFDEADLGEGVADLYPSLDDKHAADGDSHGRPCEGFREAVVEARHERNNQIGSGAVKGCRGIHGNHFLRCMWLLTNPLFRSSLPPVLICVKPSKGC